MTKQEDRVCRKQASASSRDAQIGRPHRGRIKTGITADLNDRMIAGNNPYLDEVPDIVS